MILFGVKVAESIQKWWLEVIYVDMQLTLEIQKVFLYLHLLEKRLIDVGGE